MKKTPKLKLVPSQKTPLQEKCDRALVVLDEIDRLSEERKKLYEEHDALVAEFLDVPNSSLPKIVIRRTFAKGNTQWGHGPVREYVIERVEPTPKAK